MNHIIQKHDCVVKPCPVCEAPLSAAYGCPATHAPEKNADVAQSVEQRFCKAQVAGSIPVISSNNYYATD